MGKGPVPWGDEPFGSFKGAKGVDFGIKPGDVKDLDRKIRGQARKHYPRLAARFAGWSSAKVQEELNRSPELLSPLIPPEADPMGAGRLKNHFSDCLTRGLDTDEALSGLERIQGGF